MGYAKNTKNTANKGDKNTKAMIFSFKFLCIRAYKSRVID